MIRFGRCLWEGLGYKSYKLLGESSWRHCLHFFYVTLKTNLRTMVNLCSSSQTISEKLQNRYRKKISKLTTSHITPFHQRLREVIKL